MTSQSSVGVVPFLNQRQRDILLLNRASALIQLNSSINTTDDTLLESSLKSRKRKLRSDLQTRLKFRTRSFNPRKKPRYDAKSLKPIYSTTKPRVDRPRCRGIRRRHPISDDGLANHPIKSSALPRLQTHKWHAKRMHVVRLHGWRLPQRSNDRSFQAIENVVWPSKSSQRDSVGSDRAIGGCVVQDSSFFRNMYVQGSTDYLLRIFEAHLDPCEYNDLKDKMSIYRRDPMELDLMWFVQDGFPLSAVGPVLLLVVPQTRVNIDADASLSVPSSVDDDEDTIKHQCEFMKVSISCHPAIFDEIQSELRSWQEARISHHSHWNRLRLRGPTAANVITSLLRNADVPLNDFTDSTEERKQFAKVMAPRSHVDFVAQELRKLSVRAGSAASIWTAGSVLSVDIGDPRKNRKFETTTSTIVTPSIAATTAKHLKWPKRPAQSAMWLPKDSVAFEFRKNHLINKEIQNQRSQETQKFLYRHFEKVQDISSATKIVAVEPVNSAATTIAKFIVPASTCSLLLIRKTTQAQPLKNRKRQLDGFDLIMPSAWTTAVWCHLQMAGALAVGFEEMNSLQMVCGSATFPRDFPDTIAGKRFWEERENSHRAKNALRPLRKRQQLSHLSEILARIRSYKRDESNLVLSLAATVSAAPEEGGETIVEDSIVVVRNEAFVVDFVPSSDDCREGVGSIPQLPDLPHFTLLQVLLLPCGRGRPADLAELYRPLPEDYEMWQHYKRNYEARRRLFISTGSSTVDDNSSIDNSGYRSETSGSDKKKTWSGKQDTEYDCLMSKEWPGVRLPTSEKHQQRVIGQRALIGTITSGSIEQCDTRRAAFSFGLCNAVALNDMIRDVAGRSELGLSIAVEGIHPQLHQLMLFRNCRSQWLRPALFQVTS